MTSRKDIHDKKNQYSWSAKVDFTLGHDGGFHELNELVAPVAGEMWRAGQLASLLWNQDYILALESRKIHSLQRDAGMSGYRLTIEAADTAGGAESLGKRLAFALLSVAVERRWGMALAWPDSPLPCRVVDRTASTGFTVQGFGTVTSHMYMKDFVPKLEEGFAKYHEVPDRVLLSMELFSTSRLESNNRSKLIMLVSAMEALADQKDLSAKLGDLLVKLNNLVYESDIEEEGLKDSIAGQVKNLKRESASRAVKRLVAAHGLSEADADFIKEAYVARSRILHEGMRVPDLASMIHRLEEILTKIYANS